MTDKPTQRSEDDRRADGKVARGDDWRKESKTAADVLGWDGADRRKQDRRAVQERRREERREQDAVWATDLIDDFFPMDDKVQIEHDKRQDDRRARERRAEDRRLAQVSADDVRGWNGDDRREDDRRDIERRELERRIRASQIADKGVTPGV